MKNCVIICEFNPFHKGHRYLIEQCRKSGATHITAVMSGNFVQRGDVAVISKHSRTEAILNSGVDLVLELPLPYALSHAQHFARGGVQIADSMGCADFLAFGSECGNIELLTQTATIMQSTAFSARLKQEITRGISYPDAVADAMECFGCQFRDVLQSPNNVLGIEYLKALQEIHSPITPMTFKRMGDNHHCSEIASTFASATGIRKRITNHLDFQNYVPESSYDILYRDISEGAVADIQNNMRGVLCRLRNMSVKDFSEIADVNEGLEYKIRTAVQQSVTFDEIIEKAKSRRYTYTRLRRILLSAFLGITKDFSDKPVPYLRILGFNQNGAEILKVMKKRATLPIVTKLTKLPDNFPVFGERLLHLETASTDIYYTFTQQVKPCGMEFKNGIVVR